MLKSNKKWINLVIILMLVGIGSIIAISFQSDRTLTTEQKLEDFEYLYSVLIEHQPMMEKYKEVLGYDFEESREYYKELISKTKDDYEFYVIMEMIMGDFPSSHTSLYIKSQEEIKNGGHTYSKEMKNAFWDRDRYEYWKACNTEYILEDIGETVFTYYDGQYISTRCPIAEKNEQTLILLSINDEPIDEYIKRKEVNGKLAYDRDKNKVYRHMIGLNLTYGQLVKATFQNMDGKIFEREIYMRTKDCAFEGEKIAPIETPEVNKPAILEEEVSGIQYIKCNGPFKVALDKERSLSYVFIGSFQDTDIEGSLVSDAIQKACENDNVILDLRVNEGGTREFFLEYIYPWLFKEDISINGEYFVNSATIGNKLDMGVLQKFNILNSTQGSLDGILKLRYECHGKGNGTADKNVYVLISNTSYSASDWVAAILKEYTSAVLIGSETSGEGLGGTAFMDIMPNSKLTFMVQDSQSFNSDGTDNSLYGTSPDIYIAYDFESIEKRNQLMSEGVSYTDYENRLKWDNVLLETLKIIEENERTD